MIYTQKVNNVPSRIAISGKQVYMIEADYPVNAFIRGIKDGQEWSLSTQLTSGLGANFNDYSRFGEGATSVELTSDVQQTIRFWASYADITDNRTDGLKVALTGASEILSDKKTVTDSAAVELAPIKPARRRVTFQVSGGTAYIGGAGVTSADGFEVGDGSVFEISSTAAFYAIAGTGQSVEVRILEELN
jgi:hypothetical protein